MRIFRWRKKVLRLTKSHFLSEHLWRLKSRCSGLLLRADPRIKVSHRGFHSQSTTAFHSPPVKSLRCSINYPIIGERERNRELGILPPCAGAGYLSPSLPLLLRSLSLPLQLSTFSSLYSSEEVASAF